MMVVTYSLGNTDLNIQALLGPSLSTIPDSETLTAYKQRSSMSSYIELTAQNRIILFTLIAKASLV